MPLFDQEREPNLLADEQLFRRIPVAYLALLAGVTALAWLFDEMDVAGVRPGIAIGALTGVALSLLGVVYLWTAIDMTGAFVAAGALVAIVEFASAGWVLSAFRAGSDPGHLTRRVLLVAFLAAAAGIVVQNVQS